MSVFDKFEPFGTENVNRDEALTSAAVSQAISLKRIADSLAKIEAKIPGDVAYSIPTLEEQIEAGFDVRYVDREHEFDEASKQR